MNQTHEVRFHSKYGLMLESDYSPKIAMSCFPDIFCRALQGQAGQTTFTIVGSAAELSILLAT